LSSLVLAVTPLSCSSISLSLLKVDCRSTKLVLPPNVSISPNTPLPVVVQEQVPIGGDAPLAIEGAVSVTAEDPLAVRANVSVDNKVTIGGKVDIQGKVKLTLLPVPGL